MATRLVELAFMFTLQSTIATANCEQDSCMADTVSMLQSVRVAATGAPQMCTEAYVGGRCRCNTGPGFQTFAIVVDGETRCFTTYIPLNSSGPRPVVFFINVYALDDPRKAEDTMLYYGGRGIASVFISKDAFPWKLPARTVTESNRQDCSGEDFLYMHAVFSYLDSRSDAFDANKRFLYGFSINSFFANFIGYCFSEKVQGIFQSSGALMEKGYPIADYLENPNISGFWEDPDAKYFPIYPCFESTHPVTNCFASGISDPYVWTSDYTTSMHPHAYDRTVEEGHFASIIVWTDLFGHRQSPMAEEFVIGCLGIYSPCSRACWDYTKSMVKTTCDPCSPTSGMLIAARPSTTIMGSFGGPPAGYVHQRPTNTSKCVHVNVSVEVVPVSKTRKR